MEFKEFGGPSELHLAERPLPQADANSAVVRIAPLSHARNAYDRVAKGERGHVVLKPR
jgi:hypothetical protein